MSRHSVVERSRIAVSMKIFLEIAPVKAANSAGSWRRANAGGPARSYVSWDRGTKRHAPVPVRPYLSHIACLALADTPVPTLRRQPKRTQAGVSRTRPLPLAAPGCTGGRHRDGGRVGSAAGAMPCRWRRRSGRRLQHRGARGEGLRRALRWPRSRGAQQRDWPQRERLLLRPCRER